MIKNSHPDLAGELEADANILDKFIFGKMLEQALPAFYSLLGKPGKIKLKIGIEHETGDEHGSRERSEDSE